jgi:hypothetical protein
MPDPAAGFVEATAFLRVAGPVCVWNVDLSGFAPPFLVKHDAVVPRSGVEHERSKVQRALVCY